MKTFFAPAAFALMMFAMFAAPVPAMAQVSDADARLMQSLAADEEGWAADEEEADSAAAEPEFRDEQNPQESMRRMPAPVPADKTPPQR